MIRLTTSLVQGDAFEAGMPDLSNPGAARPSGSSSTGSTLAPEFAAGDHGRRHSMIACLIAGAPPFPVQLEG